jgi:hypothetical protein
VNAVINLRVPLSAGNLTSCKSVSFSRRTLLHGVRKYHPSTGGCWSRDKVAISISHEQHHEEFSTSLCSSATHTKKFKGNKTEQFPFVVYAGLLSTYSTCSAIWPASSGRRIHAGRGGTRYRDIQSYTKTSPRRNNRVQRLRAKVKFVPLLRGKAFPS